MPPALKILISGSGIAAAVLTRCLLHALPTTQITIIEKAPSLRLTGASVDIRSSAVDIIKLMGVEPLIRTHSTQEAGISFVQGSGRVIATLGASGRTDVQSITSEYEIFRGKLADVFMAPCVGKVRMVFDETVQSYSQHDKGVDVTLAKSGETATYDLLVAADGLGSRIRGTMLAAPPRDQVVSEGVHVAYFTIPRDMLHGSRLGTWYNATGGRVVFLRPDPDTRGRTRGNLMNVTTTSPSSLAFRARLDQALKDGNEAYMQLMEESFADAGGQAAEVLKGMRESDDFYCSLFAQVRSPKLVDGRVVLLGDAGYATPGFGTSLAIMGGYVLAGELMRAVQARGGKESGEAVDVEAAASRYADLLHPFVKASQGGDVDSAMQYMNPQSAWGISVRNWIFWTVSMLRLDKLGMMAAGWFGAEAKLKMPAYEWPSGPF